MTARHRRWSVPSVTKGAGGAGIGEGLLRCLERQRGHHVGVGEDQRAEEEREIVADEDAVRIEIVFAGRHRLGVAVGDVGEMNVLVFDARCGGDPDVEVAGHEAVGGA